jgi:hypothetical protein
MKTIQTNYVAKKDILLQKNSGCGEGSAFEADQLVQKDSKIVVSSTIDQDYILININNEEPLKSGFSNLGFLIARGFIKQI